MALKDSAHFQKGKTRCKTAFVFSCPGKAEEEAKRPVSGPTGENLDKALKYLNKKVQKKFPWPCKIYYRITNAWARVEHRGTKRKRSEATDAEIVRQRNIERLFKELKRMKIIIACGNKAQLALCVMLNRHKEIRNSVKCVNVVHLSPRAKKAQKGRSVRKDIRRWATKVLSQLKKFRSAV